MDLLPLIFAQQITTALAVPATEDFSTLNILTHRQTLGHAVHKEYAPSLPKHVCP